MRLHVEGFGMPWWGWLILVCLALAVTGWITTVAIVRNMVVTQDEADRTGRRERRRRPFP